MKKSKKSFAKFKFKSVIPFESGSNSSVAVSESERFDSVRYARLHELVRFATLILEPAGVSVMVSGTQRAYTSTLSLP